ncbi:MAG: methylthioribulose 1-phosphate dehydratase [Gammaproteobacteria bacterium]|nr:methylthioribulose 1-phosphate dehydratase [Gammaproteobacteria bacterium]
MALTFDDMPARQALAQVGKQFHQRGWMFGTAGNLSKRHDEDSFWLTASGKPKGQLDENDFVRVDIHSGDMLEQLAEGNKPSAETCIHQVIYQQFSDAGACLHVHTVDAVIATQKFARDGLLRLPALEMIKGFNIWQQNPEIDLPVFDNILEVPRIAEQMCAFYQTNPSQLTAMMIRDHGITVWGRNLQEAYNRVEILEFLMSYLARQG